MPRVRRARLRRRPAAEPASGSKGVQHDATSRSDQAPTTGRRRDGAHGEWVAVLKTRDRCSSGRMPVRRACTSRQASQCGRKRTGAGVSGSGRGAPGRSSKLLPCLVSVPHKVEVRAAAPGLADADACPGRDGAPGSRSEGSQVGSHEMGSALSRGAVAGTQPMLRERQAISPPSFPRSRGRHADQVHPGAHAAQEPGTHPAQLARVPRPVGQRSTQLGSRGIHRGAVRRAVRAQEPGPSCLPDALRVGPVLVTRDDMDRGPHEGRLDHLATLQCRRQFMPSKAFDPCPEAHIGGWRVLGLQATDLGEGTRYVDARALQQQLARQERPAEGRLAEGARGHAGLAGPPATGTLVSSRQSAQMPTTLRWPRSTRKPRASWRSFTRQAASSAPISQARWQSEQCR